jgi:hypothetical protein
MIANGWRLIWAAMAIELLLSQLNKKNTLAGQEERFYTKLKKLLEEDFFFCKSK